MKAPERPSRSPSRPPAQAGQARGSVPSPRAGKKCGPSSSSSASMTSLILRSLVAPTARENSSQKSRITSRQAIRPPEMSSSCSSSPAVKPVST